MAWKSNVLVVANVTADSDELLEALRGRNERGACGFTLVVPATGGGKAGREAANEQLQAGLLRAREAGMEIDGKVGDADPIVAVQEEWDPARYDEVVVSTLPTDASRWLAMDLPHRIERITGCQVTHVVSVPRKPLPAREVAQEPEKLGLLRPLGVLSWGRSARRRRGAAEQTESKEA
jgi:hypothetical protein